MSLLVCPSVLTSILFWSITTLTCQKIIFRLRNTRTMFILRLHLFTFLSKIVKFIFRLVFRVFHVRQHFEFNFNVGRREIIEVGQPACQCTAVIETIFWCDFWKLKIWICLDWFIIKINLKIWFVWFLWIKVKERFFWPSKNQEVIYLNNFVTFIIIKIKHLTIIIKINFYA